MRHWINMLLLSREKSSLTFSSREYALAATVVDDVFPSMAAIDLRAEPIDRPFPRCPAANSGSVCLLFLVRTGSFRSRFSDNGQKKA